MLILSSFPFFGGEYPQMVEDATYLHHHHHQQQLNSSLSLDDEFDLFHPHFPSEPCSNSLPSYLLPLISPETMPSFTARSVETPQALTERPRKQLKTESRSSLCATEHKTTTCDTAMLPSPSPDSHLISFGNPDSSPAISDQFYGKVLQDTIWSYLKSESNLFSLNIDNDICLFCVKGTYQIQDCEGPNMKTAGTTSRMPVHAQEHVLAERKRREKISQRFIALSAIIPNLKKVRTVKGWKLLGVYD